MIVSISLLITGKIEIGILLLLSLFGIGTTLAVFQQSGNIPFRIDIIVIIGVIKVAVALSMLKLHGWLLASLWDLAVTKFVDYLLLLVCVVFLE